MEYHQVLEARAGLMATDARSEAAKEKARVDDKVADTTLLSFFFF